MKVKLRRGGWEVEISCPEDKVQQAVEAVIAGLSAQGALVPETEPKLERGAITCRELLRRLWEEGWFSTERTLGQVHEELARRGYHYDRTAVSHTLTDLVRDDLLTRVGTARSYRYVQKRPPS